jgi:hypothetical protein
MLFKNPVRTSKRTPHFTITRINWLMTFKKIIPVYNDCDKHTKPQIKNASSITAKGAGTDNYHSALKGYTFATLVSTCNILVKWLGTSFVMYEKRVRFSVRLF